MWVRIQALLWQELYGISSILSYEKGGALSGLSMNTGIERNESSWPVESLNVPVYPDRGERGIFLILPESIVMGSF